MIRIVLQSTHRGPPKVAFDIEPISDRGGDRLRRLHPDKLKVRFLAPCDSTGPETPRKYTLTHSDFSGDLFLTVAAHHDLQQISGLYTRMMRDEVLGEWHIQGIIRLEISLHVSGGVVLGTRTLRDRIFRRELPLALEEQRIGLPIWVEVRK
jgi:hypothetical protein